MAAKPTLKSYVEGGKLRAQPASASEVAALRRVILRDLRDARLAGLSADRRFATAYNAALQAARLMIAAAGYRLSSDAGHHRLAFEIAGMLLAPEAGALMAYFDVCRRKRNQIDYDHASVASETEADELCEKADEFRKLALEWVLRTHPGLIGRD